jgi:hypothetical protein
LRQGQEGWEGEFADGARGWAKEYEADGKERNMSQVRRHQSQLTFIEIASVSN